MYYPVVGYDDTPEGTFICFTEAGTGSISFDDGVTFQAITLPNTGVSWGPGAARGLGDVWSAVAASTTVGGRSVDGGRIFGSTTFPTAPNAYRTISYGGTGDGYFLAISASVGLSPALVAKSTDQGLSYTGHNQVQFTTARTLFWCKEPGLWVAAGGLANPTLRVLTSPAGEAGTWTGRTTDDGVFKAGVWMGDAAVIVGNDGVIGGAKYFIRSTDLVTWDALSNNAGGSGLAYDGTNLVAIQGTVCWHSTDKGLNWTQVTVGSHLSRNYVDIANNGRVFCAVSFNDGVGLTATSPTGAAGTWTERQNNVISVSDNYVRIVSGYRRPGYL